MNRNHPEVSLTQHLVAALLILLGAVCFSAKAVLVKLAYPYGIDSVSLLTLRMIFSLPFFAAIAWWVNRKGKKRAPRVSCRDWLRIGLLGLTGFYFASLLDFLGLQYITASMERLILFMYPTMVILISALYLKRRVSRLQWLALALTYFGITLAFVENLGREESSNFLLGALLIFSCAFAYAIYLIGSGALLPRIGTLRYTSFAMISAALAVILHHGIAYQWQLFDFPSPVYRLALLMSILSTVFPSFLISEGIRVIGSDNASIVGSIGPISTIVLAYIFLGERLGWLQWMGTFLVIGGVLVITLRK